MNETIKRAIIDKIEQYERIMLFRHIRMDGDCAGASKGLKEMIAATFPDSMVLFMFLIPLKMKWLGFVYDGWFFADVFHGQNSDVKWKRMCSKSC